MMSLSDEEREEEENDSQRKPHMEELSIGQPERSLTDRRVELSSDDPEEARHGGKREGHWAHTSGLNLGTNTKTY